MTDITKIEHDGPVTTCGIDTLEGMTLSGWRVIAVTKLTVPRSYRGHEYNSTAGRYEDAYNEAHEVLTFVLGRREDQALEEAWAGKQFAEVERDRALVQVTETLKDLMKLQEEATLTQKRLEQVVDECNDMHTALQASRQNVHRGETALGDLRRDFAKVKAAIGELRIKEILG